MLGRAGEAREQSDHGGGGRGGVSPQNNSILCKTILHT